MWVFLNNSFLSIVAHRDKPDSLMVRARFAGDIEQVFPSYVAQKTPDGDYLFRAVIPRGVVQAAIAANIASIDYPNFKGSVEEQARHDAYLGAWSVMHRAQKNESN